MINLHKLLLAIFFFKSLCEFLEEGPLIYIVDVYRVVTLYVWITNNVLSKTPSEGSPPILIPTI